MMDSAERRTVETLKSSFKHIATTLDATCITSRPQPRYSTSLSASPEPGPLNTSLSRILTDHHRIRGSALRCLMTALDIDRLAIDKAYRHIALLHGTGQHREAGQAERAMKGYPPLLEVLHVVMEKNGVEEWDRWTRRQENAEKDEALGSYVPFPFRAAAAASSSTVQPLPLPIAHLLPTLAERQMHDEPPPSSPPRSPPRTFAPPLSVQPQRPHTHSGLEHRADVGDKRSPDNETLLKRAIEADNRARAKRVAAKAEKERQTRLHANKLQAIRAAEEDKNEEDEEEKGEQKEDEDQAKEELSKAEKRMSAASKEQPITIDEELDAEVRQLSSVNSEGSAGDVRPDDSSPTDAALPARPQMLAAVSHSPNDASPVNGTGNGSSELVSPYSDSSPGHANGSSLHSHAAMDGNSAASPQSMSFPPLSSYSFARTDSSSRPDNSSHSSSHSPLTATRPARTRKKAPRYGEDDLYTPNSPSTKPHRPSPHKPSPKPAPASPAPAVDDEDRLWEVESVLCYRFRAYPPFHELAGLTYRSFLMAWKEYPRATWVMEEELVCVDRRRLERLLEYDAWRDRPESQGVEVEEEEPWLVPGDEGADGGGGREQKKRKRTAPRLGASRRKKRS